MTIVSKGIPFQMNHCPAPGSGIIWFSSGIGIAGYRAENSVGTAVESAIETSQLTFFCEFLASESPLQSNRRDSFSAVPGRIHSTLQFGQASGSFCHWSGWQEITEWQWRQEKRNPEISSRVMMACW